MIVNSKTDFKFTETERKALEVISQIDCQGVRCCDCPFNDRTNYHCYSTMMGVIAYKGGVDNGTDN